MKYPVRASKYLEAVWWPATDSSKLPSKAGELGD